MLCSGITRSYAPLSFATSPDLVSHYNIKHYRPLRGQRSSLEAIYYYIVVRDEGLRLLTQLIINSKVFLLLLHRGLSVFI